MDTKKWLYVPKNIGQIFIAYAQNDLDSNTETMAILGGTEVSEGYKITHLLIPNQFGNSDSCQMHENSVDWVLQQSINNNITILGWIHTHPSQTNFLSSVDLHASYSYQQTQPLSIAIVYSGIDQSCKYYKITDLGMNILKNCKLPLNTHHVHIGYPDNNGLFELHTNYKLKSKINIKTIDGRPDILESSDNESDIADLGTISSNASTISTITTTSNQSTNEPIAIILDNSINSINIINNNKNKINVNINNNNEKDEFIFDYNYYEYYVWKYNLNTKLNPKAISSNDILLLGHTLLASFLTVKENLISLAIVNKHFNNVIKLYTKINIDLCEY